MKKAFFMLGFALMVICYYYTATPLFINDSVSKDVIEEYSFIPSPLANLAGGVFCGRFITKNTLITSFACANNLLEDFVIDIYYTDQLLATKFTQYSFFSINLLIEKKKSFLVFPFHYFW